MWMPAANSSWEANTRNDLHLYYKRTGRVKFVHNAGEMPKTYAEHKNCKLNVRGVKARDKLSSDPRSKIGYREGFDKPVLRGVGNQQLTWLTFMRRQ